MRIFQENLNLLNIMDKKPILAIETSASLCGTCVYFSDKRFFETNIQLKNSHAEKLFDAIDFTLKSANVDVTDLGGIAVSSGPGSFTGLRIGMSAAKGIAFGANLPIIPVPTFEALALQLGSTLSKGTGIVIAIRVNMEEVYYAGFQITGNNYIFADNLTILTHAEFKKKAKNTFVFGNVGKALVGDVAKEYFEISSPKPEFVARWCELYGADFLTYDYDYLEPNYLKKILVKAAQK